MTPELKAKWIAALRSGEYKQTRGRLLRNWRGEDRFCCLGVLCEIMEAPRAVGAAAKDKSGPGYRLDDTFHDAELPCSVLSAGDQNILVKLNDSHRRSFAKIADWIEENM